MMPRHSQPDNPITAGRQTGIGWLDMDLQCQRQMDKNLSSRDLFAAAVQHKLVDRSIATAATRPKMMFHDYRPTRNFAIAFKNHSGQHVAASPRAQAVLTLTARPRPRAVCAVRSACTPL